MSFCFRRLYATLPKLPEPVSPSAARALSSPLQVRRRRLRKQLTTPTPEESQLTPTERARYKRLKRLGAFLKEDKEFQEPTEDEWLSEVNERRTRIRGAVRRAFEDPETGENTTIEDVVGRRVYLPNMIFRMVRNYTLPGQPYNPWEATFRIPISVTKLDIRSYLHAVYGVKCTYIRTDNYFSPLRMAGAYKRAVVGLVEPFYYPEALEDMGLEERQAREKWFDDRFSRKQHLEDVKMRQKQRILQNKTYDDRKVHSWDLTGNRGSILRSVIARRKAREQSVDEGAQTLLKSSQVPTAQV